MDSRTVCIELPFGVELEEVHCPACGKLVPYEEVERDACPHIAFIYCDYVGEFAYIAPRLQELAEEVGGGWEESSEEGVMGDPMEALLKALPSGSLFCLGITTGGMTCAPVWTTFHVAFEFHLPEEA